MGNPGSYLYRVAQERWDWQETCLEFPAGTRQELIEMPVLQMHRCDFCVFRGVCKGAAEAPSIPRRTEMQSSCDSAKALASIKLNEYY